jgi:hypothetical protein
MRRMALVLLGALASATPAAAEPVRIFAVGYKLRLEDAVSHGAFRDTMGALMDATHPARARTVQPGAGDVASHLRPADPAAPARALVVFPEDVGLPAALIGSRGALARTQTGAAGAIASLLATYGPQFAYYSGKYPANPLVRNLVLAITDTVYRSFYETFRDLAITHGVYLAACANLPPARRVEEASEPGLVALLRDPDEPGRSYAYEATSPLPYNTTLLFAPDGEVLVPDGGGGTRRSPSQTDGVILGSANKAYLTPIEQPPPGNDGGLALATGAVRDLEVLDTPVGRIAIVISKDAWMIDVNDRLAAKGANVVLQPEAFSAWGYTAAPWEPDIFKEGGFATLQKMPEFRVNVSASMTGNFFDVTFDGQSAVIGRKQKPGAAPPTNAWIGQNPDTGFLALAPWVVPDPGAASPGLGLAARRAALAAEGAKLLPGSGVDCGGSLVAGACDNGYREAVVFADVDVPEAMAAGMVDPVRESPPRFRRSVRVPPEPAVPSVRRAPRVAARGSRVYVVWHEEAGGLPNVLLAVSRNRGASFSAPVRVSDNPPGAVAELHPAIAVRKKRVFVSWQELARGRDDDAGRIMLARLDLRGRKVGPAVRVDDHDGGGAWLPSVTVVRGDPVVAWVDERDRGPEGEPLEHVYAARGIGGGARFMPAVRIDAGAPDALALHDDNRWAPSLAALGKTVFAAWADFRSYNWDIYLARSDDGGASWGANVRVDDFPDLERLNERPVIGLDRRGPVHVVWTDLRAREPDTNIFHARSDDRGDSFAASRQLDDSKLGFDPDTDTPSNQWHPALAVAGRRLFVAWQDNRLGNNDIFFTTSSDAGATFAAAERVDDTGAGGSEQTRPSLAVTGQGAKRRCYVVWEDDRDGRPDVYLGRRACGPRQG